MIKSKWSKNWLREARDYFKEWNQIPLHSKAFIPETDRKMHEIGAEAIDTVLEMIENPQFFTIAEHTLLLDDQLYYAVVECKNIFSDKGYRINKILRFVRDGEYSHWVDVHKVKLLDKKYKVVAFYPIPEGQAWGDK